MMRISTVDIFQRATDNLNTQQSLLIDIQSKISTGKKLLAPAEDPIAALSALQCQSEIQAMQQSLSSANNAANYLEYKDSIFNTITLLYQKLQELTIYAGNASLSHGDRINIAIEMEEILEELVSLANSKGPNGDYLFSGFKTETQPILQQYDDSYFYAGDEGSKTIMMGEQCMLDIGDSGKELFFSIPCSQIEVSSSKGSAILTTLNPGLVDASTLTSLATNDLKINNIDIPFSINDEISTSDPAGSAIAIKNAINAKTKDHQVVASVDETQINLGVYTAFALSQNQFTINAIDIIDTVGTENSLIDTINSETSMTGVVATQPAGPGTAIWLSAEDGRNIQLQTNGLSQATFSQFDLSTGPLDKVIKADVTLRSHVAIDISGQNPLHAGLSVSQTNISTNAGNAEISSKVVVSETAQPNASYTIIFDNPATTFHIISDADPLVNIPKLENIPYVAGEIIEFEGVQITIQGQPHAGDELGVNLKPVGLQAIFTSIKNIITGLKQTDSATIDYTVSEGIKNLNFAQETLALSRAKIGAKLNAIDHQKSYQDMLLYLTQNKLSGVADLDYNDAISKLSQHNLILQAAQQSFVRIQSLTLFNYIR